MYAYAVSFQLFTKMRLFKCKGIGIFNKNQFHSDSLCTDKKKLVYLRFLMRNRNCNYCLRLQIYKCKEK